MISSSSGFCQPSEVQQSDFFLDRGGPPTSAPTLSIKSSNRLKWFRQDVIRANSARLRFVERLKGANEEHHRNVFQLLVFFDVLADLIAILSGHENVCEHYIRRNLLEMFNCLLAVTKSHDSHTFVSECKVDNFLNGDRIVGK